MILRICTLYQHARALDCLSGLLLNCVLLLYCFLQSIRRIRDALRPLYFRIMCFSWAVRRTLTQPEIVCCFRGLIEVQVSQSLMNASDLRRFLSVLSYIDSSINIVYFNLCICILRSLQGFQAQGGERRNRQVSPHGRKKVWGRETFDSFTPRGQSGFSSIE